MATKCRSEPASAIVIVREDCAWLVLAGEHGWLHGDRRAAQHDAEWLKANLDPPIQEHAT
jgi:hypothetical protein